MLINTIKTPNEEMPAVISTFPNGKKRQAAQKRTIADTQGVCLLLKVLDKIFGISPPLPILKSMRLMLTKEIRAVLAVANKAATASACPLQGEIDPVTELSGVDAFHEEVLVPIPT